MIRCLCEMSNMKKSAAFPVKIVIFLAMVTRILASLECTGTCRAKRDKINQPVACSLRNFPANDFSLLSPRMDPCGPSKPVNFEGRVLFPTNDLSAELEYTWQSPEDSSVDDLVGFQINIVFPERMIKSPPRVYRILFDNSSTHRGWSYELSCKYNEPSFNVRVLATCLSLPMCDNNYSNYSMPINISAKQRTPTTTTTLTNYELNTISAYSLYEHVSSTSDHDLLAKQRTPTATTSNRELHVIIVVITLVVVVFLAGFVWFIRCKVLTSRKTKILNHAKEDCTELTDIPSTYKRHVDIGDTSDFDRHGQRKFHNGQENTRENVNNIPCRNVHEHMNFTVRPTHPCSLHGCVPPAIHEPSDILANRITVESHIQSNPRRERILMEKFPEGIYESKPTVDTNTIITADNSDDDNGVYNSMTIEEKMWRLNEENM